MIPQNLKRIKVISEQELRSWLAKQVDPVGTVMIVTCNRTSPTKYVSSEQVRGASADHGWQAGPSYTLKGKLVGHILRHG